MSEQDRKRIPVPTDGDEPDPTPEDDIGGDSTQGRGGYWESHGGGASTDDAEPGSSA